MALPVHTQFFEPWSYHGVAGDPTLALRQLNDRLLELAQKYSVLAQHLSFGPVPGAYQVLQFLIRDWDAPTTAVDVGDLSPAIVLPAECVPMALSVSTVEGSATVQLRDGTTNLLTAALDSAAAEPYICNAADFATSRFEKGASLNLRAESITGSPLAIYGTLWVNQFPKVCE